MSAKNSKQEKRPSSDNFVDIHVFVVPYELWMEKYRTAYNSSTLESISAGFVRVPPTLTLEDLRSHIKQQLGGTGILPKEYVFLRSVGRCLAIVNKIQELSLKVKHFLPPVVPSPEIFVLFGKHDSLTLTLASVNSGSDTQDYAIEQEYPPFSSNEMKEKSRYSSPESSNPEQMDRHVHFNHSNDNKNADDSENPDCVLKEAEETDLAKSPEVTKADLTAEELYHGSQHVTDTLNSNGQYNLEISLNEEVQVASEFHENVKENEVNVDRNNVVISSVTSNVEASADCFQLSSNLKDQPDNSPWSRIEKKNPLVHSKTSPSLLRGSTNENEDKEDETYEENERNSAKINESKETDGNLDYNGKERNVKSTERPNHSLSDSKNERTDKNTGDLDCDLKKGSSESQTHLARLVRDGSGQSSQSVESTKDDFKHSAENSAASSGFESLNQSNNNTNAQEHANDTGFGVTIADKESLLLQLQAELNAVRRERSSGEKVREQLLRKAKNLQNKNNERRNQAKNVWKKKYLEEKKQTASLEERCNQLRYEVEAAHKKILSSVDPKDQDSSSGNLRPHGNPDKMSTKILLSRKENEVEELRRRVEEARIKLGSEMKLRDNAQKELKQIREEVVDKKINATLAKKSLSQLETRAPNDT